MDQTRQSVEEAEPEEIELEETQQRREQDMSDACMPAPGDGILRRQRRIAVLLGEIAVERFGRVVQQVAFDPADLAIGYYLLMHGIVRPARMATVEQAQAPVGVALAMAQIAAHEAIAAGKPVGPAGWSGQRRFDALAQTLADALVGIDAEHPVVAGLFDSELLLRPETAPFSLNDARAQLLRFFDGTVGTA